MRRIGRSDPCRCGSNRQYQHCHLLADLATNAITQSPVIPPRAMPQLSVVGEMMIRDSIANEFSGPTEIKAIVKGRTFRAIGNRLYKADEGKSEADFLRDLLLNSFGRNWYDLQSRRPKEQQHIVYRWNHSWFETLKASIPENSQKGRLYKTAITGDGRSLLLLGRDLYRLQRAGVLTRSLTGRLRDHREFQGARYEITVASVFLSCGFKIEWVNGKERRHCEFYAVHPRTKTRIAVEAKSRRRPGVFNEPGVQQVLKGLEFEGLLSKAMRQNPNDRPFAIFIDVNAPPTPLQSNGAPSWSRELLAFWDRNPIGPENPDPISMLVLTNYPWHYVGKSIGNQPPEFVHSISVHAVHPIADMVTYEALGNALNAYGVVSAEERSMISAESIDAIIRNLPR